MYLYGDFDLKIIVLELRFKNQNIYKRIICIFSVKKR